MLRTKFRNGRKALAGLAGREAGIAEPCQGKRGIPGRETLPACVSHECVVQVAGLRQIEDGLKKPVHVRRGKEVLTTRDVGDVLFRVVGHHGEMIGRPDVLAGENDIAKEPGIDRVGAQSGVLESERAGCLGRPARIEAPGKSLPGADAVRTFRRRKGPAGAGVEGTLRSMRGVPHRLDLLLDFSAGTEAGIHYATIAKASQGILVEREPLGLMKRFTVPSESQPAEVLLDLLIILGAGARVINVLEAQKEPASRMPREIVRHHCGVGMAEMKPPGRAGCETRRHAFFLTNRGRAGHGKPQAAESVDLPEIIG